MEPFDTFAVGDYICELHYDENPSSPAEWDTLGEMYPLVRSAQYLGFRDVSDTHGQAIVREWADYLEGNVLGFVVRHRDGFVVDSVWGFYPDESRDGLDYIRQEARASAEWHAQQDAESFRYLAL